MDVHGVDSQTVGPTHVRDAEPCLTVEERRAPDRGLMRVLRNTETEEEGERRRAKAQDPKRLARAKALALQHNEEKVVERRARDRERKHSARILETEEEVELRRATDHMRKRIARAKVAAEVSQQQHIVTRTNSRAGTRGHQRVATTRAFAEGTAVEHVLQETREAERLA